MFLTNNLQIYYQFAKQSLKYLLWKNNFMFVYWMKKKNPLWSQKKNNFIVSTSSKPFYISVDGRVTEIKQRTRQIKWHMHFWQKFLESLLVNLDYFSSRITFHRNEVILICYTFSLQFKKFSKSNTI